MHIKSIELSGFKSYGNKTEIKGFDPFFNAITGLNGSGKSNILDSICFVLGISNLSQVRASNLQELVYKNGQAGITKASVSIVFDNSDPASSPVGYEMQKEIVITRIVVIGGRNKYLINGTTANNHRVQDLFQSVQLNVNNPHFLIMQGRITKVLNMKPMEILSMVEEAAGTRMYEVKKDNSLKLMKRKDDKLAEIDRIFNNELCPNMEKLKKERKEYIEYTKICRDLEHAGKLQIAWEFVQLQKMSRQSQENMLKYRNEYNNTEKNVESLKNLMEELTTKIAEMEKQRNEAVGGKLHSLEASLKEKQMEETKAGSALQNLKSVLKDDSKKKAQLVKNLNEDKSTLSKKQKDKQDIEKKMNEFKETQEADANAVSEAEKHLHNVNAGLIKDQEGKAATIASQQILAEQDIQRSDTEIKTASMALTSLNKDLTKKQSSCNQMDTSYRTAQSSFQSLESELKNLKSHIDKIGYNEQKFSQIKTEKITLEREICHLKEQIEEMESRFPQLTFDYVDPMMNFDRSKVHGLVCKLIDLKDEKTATALEIAAGGKLHSIVVENDNIAKMLLNKGQLKRRVTMIPLNKIRGTPIQPDVVRRAQNLVGKENVAAAISLVNYDKNLHAAMEYVFGNTFICPDMESAKKVAFGDGIRTRCVTLDGEVFDPAGTLSGGSMNNRVKLLAELAKMKELNHQLQVKSQRLKVVLKELHIEMAKCEKHDSLQEKYEMKQSELMVCKSKMEQSNYHQQIKEIENLQRSIEDLRKKVDENKEIKKKAEQRLKELKGMDSKSAVQQELKKAEKSLMECQKQAAASEKNYKKAVQDFEQIELEIKDIMESIENCEQQIESLTGIIRNHETEIEAAENNVQEKKKAVQDLIEEVKMQKSTLKAHSVEISKLATEREAVSKNFENGKLQMQQLEHDIAKSEENAGEAEKNVGKYLTTYEWIEEEKKYFGEPNTEYDFRNYNRSAAAARHTELEEAKQRLSKNINVRAQHLLSQAEEKFHDLQAKKKVVLTDKKQIERVISELDEKKRSVLKTACEKVNKDFGSIFSTLLPGAKAQLLPQHNKNVLEGLEFKVGFGDSWKESLAELSGGQRSLVALSLILALLLFKPAPIYILDEVDAALDLSHTQNIGQMLKKHFQKSQFIVVSLKDGMFDNANVLFKTQFVDGMSTVKRTIPTKK